MQECLLLRFPDLVLLCLGVYELPDVPPVLYLVLPQVSHVRRAAELDCGVGGALGVPGGQDSLLEIPGREVKV